METFPDVGHSTELVPYGASVTTEDIQEPWLKKARHAMGAGSVNDAQSIRPTSSNPFLEGHKECNTVDNIVRRTHGVVKREQGHQVSSRPRAQID